MFSCYLWLLYFLSAKLDILNLEDILIINKIKNKMDLGFFKIGRYVDLGLFKTKGA